MRRLLQLDIKEQDLTPHSSRIRAIATACREYGYRLREIADLLGVHYSTVSRRLKKQEE